MNPTMSVKTDAAYQDDLLIERIKNGDNAAYDDMVSRYWDRIFARVHHLLKNQQDARSDSRRIYSCASRTREFSW